jgi:hypothetical protein
MAEQARLWRAAARGFGIFSIASSIFNLEKTSPTSVAKSLLLYISLAETACKFASG